MCPGEMWIGAVHLRACVSSTSRVHSNVCCVREKNAAGVSRWRKSRTGACDCRSGQDLTCSVTHARLPHGRAPHCARGSLFLVSAGRDPNHLFPSSPGGEAFFNACLLRRTHQAMKSCPASVATVRPHFDAQVLPSSGGHGKLIHSSPGCDCPVATVPKAEAKGGSLSSFTTFSHAAAANPTMPITPLRAKLLLSSHSPSPPRGSGAPPFSQVASSRLPKTVRVRYQEQAWSAARR